MSCLLVNSIQFIDKKLDSVASFVVGRHFFPTKQLSSVIGHHFIGPCSPAYKYKFITSNKHGRRAGIKIHQILGSSSKLMMIDL